MRGITTCLWFDGQAEDAAKFYTGIFNDSTIGDILRCGDAGPGPRGSVLTVEFELAGRKFMGLNGGPQYKFTPAVSLSVACDTQAEVDYYWQRLGEGGTPVQCGWMRDKFGLSWQIVPVALPRLLAHPDPAKAARVMKAMMGMIKLDAPALERAAQGDGHTR